MCLLFETIRLKDGNFCNLRYHSERMNNARKILFKSDNDIDLQSVLSIPVNCKKGIYKCRVDYDHSIRKIDFTPYEARKVSTLQLVYDNDISYSFKYADRTRFEELKKQAKADEILIVKNGFITDTSFSNIIFFDGYEWITPSTPLLRGTKRQQLLDGKAIHEKTIVTTDLRHFVKAMLINAMLDFENGGEIEMGNIIGI